MSAYSRQAAERRIGCGSPAHCFRTAAQLTLAGSACGTIL